jgi:glycerol-3-phosphate acyltransferase PlsX
MPQKVRIALDAMGGDHGPSVVVAGADLALAQHPDSMFILFGDQAQVEPLLAGHPRLKAGARLVHTDVAVRMDDKPSQALRNGRWKSSMWLAIDAVKKGEADVAISAGNTGALMAMAKFNLKMLPGIERPAIAALWPTLKGTSIVLDLGASIGADADHLIDLAVMGSAMARVLYRIDRPSVGLLNIGVEEGNIALKTAEGTARQFAEYLRGAISQSILSKIGYLLARPAFRMLRDKMDPRKSNGGVFLGLNGVVIKSHGGTDPEGFAAAIEMGYDMVHHELLAKIGATIRRHATATQAARAVGGAAS